jgi:hypothetical protein
MSYVSRIAVVKNDYGYDLEFKLTDAEGNAVDLSGATSVKVFIAEPGSSTAKVVGTCTVTDATGGLCKYTVQSGDFDTANKTYDVEVEITYSDRVVTAKGVKIVVLPELPETTS